ncbi:MAG: sigma-70 family RNA polymerase sigma factor [Clostridium sp.]|nr:sigma-70 family RNA polymerase sigma factor [Clostridium sp.]
MEKRMEDEKIIQLIWDREEQGLRELSDKYNNYCYSISYRIVHDEEDAMECVNDTWFRTWNAIPPKRPAVLPGFLAKIVRNLSLNRYRHMHTERRGGNSVDIALEELQECVSDGRTVEEQIELQELSTSIARFLNRQSERNRAIFLQRYFYMMQTKEIAEKLGIREGTVRSILSRMRKDLRGWLEKEAVYL